MNRKRSRRHGLTAVLTACIGLLILSACGQPMGTPSNATPRSGDQYFSRALASMRSARSYHMIGIRPARKWQIDLTASSGRVIIEELSTPDGDSSYIDSDGARYLKAGASFLASNAVVAQNAAGRWIALPAAYPHSIDNAANLSTTAACILGRHGTTTVRGQANVAGVPVVEVDDLGDVAGSFPGKFFFAAGGGDLVQIIQTGPGHPGGPDTRCADGLVLFPVSAADVGTFLFDGWSAKFTAIAPADAISLEDAPFCGTPLGQELSVAAQQYLLASFHWNKAILAVSESCGCNHGATYSQFRSAVLAEVAANQAYGAAISRLTVTGNTLVDAQALVAATQAEDQLFLTAAATPNFATYNAYANAIDQARNRAGDAAWILRSDLDLGQSSCSYVIP
jgi:hypothetical protein